jgi:membrane protein insertase Oxa1/YidC/SpoIIIJ
MNNSTGSLTLNNCNDISLHHAGQKVDLVQKECNDTVIESGKESVINFSDDYNSFFEAGQYNFEYSKDDKRYLASFEVEHRGSISKIFSAVFYAPIFNLFVFLITTLGNSLGWAILAITVVIRVVLLWPQHKMMVAQKKLQRIQPKIKKIQEENK